MRQWSKKENARSTLFVCMKLSAIILAAGMSTRMGHENKLLLNYKNSSLINETIQQLSTAKGIDEIIVVLGHEAQVVQEHIINKELSLAVNKNYKTGQTTSIQAGVKASHPLTDGFMICLGDMPFILSADYECLIDFWNDKEPGLIIRPKVNDLPGHPVIFDASYKEDILAETHPHGCRTVIAKHKDRYIEFKSTNRHYLIDIDKPADKDRLS